MMAPLKKIKIRHGSLFGGQGGNSGFTIIEMMISLVIFSIVVAGIVSASMSQQGQNMSQSQAVEMQQTVRASTLILTKEIRMAGYNPHEDDYDAEITAAGDGSNTNPLTFAYVKDDDGLDNDGDGVTDEKGELRTFSYEMGTDNTIRDANNQPVANNINALSFIYLDENNTVTADIDQIRAIQVTVAAMVDPGELDYSKGANTQRVLTTTVMCRNLGL